MTSVAAQATYSPDARGGGERPVHGWKATHTALLLLVLAGGCAGAGTQLSAVSLLTPWPWSAIQEKIPKSDPMPSGIGEAPPPNGYVSFCLRYKNQCFIDMSQDKIVHLDKPTWQLLQRVNVDVNVSVRVEDDKRHYGRPEYWALAEDGWGDCEDFALLKQKKLMDAGLPLRALRLAVVDTRRQGGHAVLTVATDDGDYVLDNLTNEILPWREPSYKWYKRQDPDEEWGWVQLNPQPGPVYTGATGARCRAAKVADNPLPLQNWWRF